jgi:DNA-binding SARP family transcriptional activator
MQNKISTAVQPQPPMQPVALPKLAIRVFGASEVLVNETSAQWHAQGAKSLLLLLLSLPEGASKERIMEMLWAVAPDPASNNRFRVTVHRLRATLGWHDAIVEQHGRYRLASEVLAASDVFAFYQALEQAEHGQDNSAKLASYQRALGIYGEYLPEEDGEWAILAREEHKSAYVRACLELSLIHCDHQSCEAAVGALVRALKADPYIGENYHQKLMTCLTVVEDKYAAIEHYRRFLGFLRSEIGDTPMDETRDLAEQIKIGRVICQRGANVIEPQQSRSCPLTAAGHCPRPLAELLQEAEMPIDVVVG